MRSETVLAQHPKKTRDRDVNRQQTAASASFNTRPACFLRRSSNFPRPELIEPVSVAVTDWIPDVLWPIGWRSAG